MRGRQGVGGLWAVLRGGRYTAAMDVLSLGAVTVDLGNAEVLRHGEVRSLTPIEVRLLRYLGQRAGSTVPRDELLREVWEYAPGVRTRAVDNTMGRLRRKIEEDSQKPSCLLSVRGVGYRLVVALPTPAAPSLLGRDKELAELAAALGENARLVTLHGPGGIGKTTMARVFLEYSWQDALWIDLSAARDLDDVLSVTADALGVQLGPNPVAQLVVALAVAPRNMVMDNGETVTEALRAVLPRWLDASSEVRCLLTTQERLRIDEEHVIGLGPLSPSDGAALLATRAAEGGATLAEADLAVLPQLAEALDGLPLALELAAARCRVVPPAAVLERLGDRFRMLATGASQRPERHRSLAASLADSWDRLSQECAEALACCSVFVGTFDLVAAEAVCDGWVLDTLEELVDHALLVAQRGHFRLLHAVAAFVRERPELDVVRAEAEGRHCAWARSRVDVHRPRVHGPEGAEHLRALGQMLPELRAALRRSVALSRSEDAERIGVAVVAVATRLGPLHIGVDAADRVLEAVPGGALGLRLRGQLAASQGRVGAGLSDLDLAMEVAEGEEQARCLVARAGLRLALGRIDEAEQDVHRVLASAGGVSLGDAHRTLGAVARLRGEQEQAAVQYRAALACYPVEEGMDGRAWALGYLGDLAADAGDVEQARAAYAEALALREGLGDRRHAAVLRTNLAQVLHEAGDLAGSRRAWQHALTVHRQLGNIRFAAWCEVGLGTISHEEGDFDDALARYRLASAQLERLGETRFQAFVWARMGAALNQSGLAGAQACFARAVEALPPSEKDAVLAWQGLGTSSNHALARLGRRVLGPG
jgi:predicted ATPase/DNA-binding winged helix-turn-helix (wHTH) protein